jgi:hypothetical protein
MTGYIVRRAHDRGVWTGQARWSAADTEARVFPSVTIAEIVVGIASGADVDSYDVEPVYVPDDYFDESVAA